jgi:hypothetical protein
MLLAFPVPRGEVVLSSRDQAAPARPAHPVQAAVNAAIARLAAFTPTRIVGEPDAADANGLIDDLFAMAAIVDPVIAAIGDYADSAIGLPRADRALFVDQLRQALEGNATYVVTRAIEDRIGSRREDAAEARAAFRRRNEG